MPEGIISKPLKKKRKNKDDRKQKWVKDGKGRGYRKELQGGATANSVKHRCRKREEKKMEN